MAEQHMNDTEINYQIARATGRLKHNFDETRQCRHCYMFEREDPHNECPMVKVPEYASSLEAMHEAEVALTDEQCRVYNEALAKVVVTPNLFSKRPFGYIWHADAKDRATAFLKIVNL